jgi:hypothetical protein
MNMTMTLLEVIKTCRLACICSKMQFHRSSSSKKNLSKAANIIWHSSTVSSKEQVENTTSSMIKHWPSIQLN